MTPPKRIIDEARRLAKKNLFHGGVEWGAADIAEALLAAEQRGRDEERAERDRRRDEYYSRWMNRRFLIRTQDKG